MATTGDCTEIIVADREDYVQRDDYSMTRSPTFLGSDKADVDIDEAWCHFEVARRSAEFYMDKYFQQLETESLETSPDMKSGTVVHRGEQLRDSHYWTMKVARDCLIKDLNNMNFWIQRLALLQLPKFHLPTRATCLSGFAVAVSQLVEPDRVRVVLNTVKGAALLTLVSSLAHLLYLLGRREAFSYFRKSIVQCMEATYGWTLTDSHRRTVKKHPYQVLRALCNRVN